MICRDGVSKAGLAKRKSNKIESDERLKFISSHFHTGGKKLGGIRREMAKGIKFFKTVWHKRIIQPWHKEGENFYDLPFHEEKKIFSR